MTFNVGNLVYFYFTLALLAVALAIVIYAVLRYDRPQKRR